MKFMVRDPAASSTPLADRAYTVIQDQLIMLDIPPHAAIVEGAWVEKPDLGKVDEIGWTELAPGGNTPASSRVDWIEVYGKPVKR